ncbi:VWFA and cache domain-containing protein 1-like [Saccoglossus kowalevskii]
MGLDIDYRLCQVCDMMAVEDEYHFIMICPLYEMLRKRFIPIWAYTNPSDYFNELDFKSDNLMGAETVAKLKNALANKIDGNVQALMDLSNAVEASFQEPEVSFPECCKLNDDDLEYYPRLRKKIDFENPCLRYAKYGDRGGRMLSDGVLSVMKTNFEKNRELKWQYFGSEEGVFTFYPGTSRALCDDYDHRFRPWYVETATPEPKNVVIVMDASGSMQRAFPHCEQQGTLMHIAKSASIDVLRTMNPIDKVGVIAFSDGVRVPSGDDETSDCYGYQLASATPLNINYLISDFVNTISDNGDTHYITAFEKAFDLLEASQPVEGELQRDQVILFLTDGEPTDGGESVSLLEKKRNIIHTIVRRNAKMNNEVVIFTFGLGEDPDHQFLRHIAEQDGTVYNVQRNNTAGEVTPGHYKHVSDACKLRTIMASYYDFFSHRTQQSDSPVFSVPYQGATGTGLMTTVALPVKYDGQLKGVVGVDITLDDLLSDVTFFKEGDLSYAFIYESGTKAEGRTLMHPLAPAPIRIQDDPVFVHIWSLERDNIFRSNIYGNVTRVQLLYY